MERFIMLVLLLVVGMALGAAVVPAYQLMWGWFVTPTFGIEVPKFGLMWGLLMFIGLLTHRSSKEDDDVEEAFKRSIGITIVVWLVCGMSKLVHILFV